MVKTTEETRQVGASTATTLAQNTDRLRLTEKGLDEIESNLTQAKKELASFAKRIATDKVIMGLACLVVLGIIGIIVYSIINPNAQTNVPYQFKPTALPTVRK